MVLNIKIVKVKQAYFCFQYLKLVIPYTLGINASCINIKFYNKQNFSSGFYDIMYIGQMTKPLK